ncbi:hypothetical protein ACQ902_004017 [Vibrio mimicus]
MNKKILTIGTIIAVFGIAILTRPNSGGFELPDCNFEKVANTKINFFVDQEVLETSSLEEIKKSLQSSIKYANQVLRNSCVPLTRSLGDISPLYIDKNEVRSLDAARKLIRMALEKQKILVENLVQMRSMALYFMENMKINLDFLAKLLLILVRGSSLSLLLGQYICWSMS